MAIASRIALAGALCLCLTAYGQKGGGSSSGGSGDSSGGPGFSIETEMFTYKAVEQNSEAIACDIARYLYGNNVQDAPKGSHVPCVVQNEGQNPQGIVLISTDSTLVGDFQIWRADMATMDDLRGRAATLCVAGPGKEAAAPKEHGGQPQDDTGTRGLGSTVGSMMSGAQSVVGMLNPGASAASAVMGMLSSSQSVTPVVGTVHDPALMNEVARQLRSLNIQVLIPELYSPNGLSGPDPSHSPYLRNLQNLMSAYDGCMKVRDEYPKDSPQAKEISDLADFMLKFATSVTTGPAPSAKPSGSGSGGGGSDDSSSPAPSKAQPHFAAVLAADAVARKLGIGEDPGAAPNKTWQHLLWVKALESGGSVTRTSNIFGTKVRFGGGAVDTFAVFRLDGDLVCSGNVYSFQSPVRMKDLDRKFGERPSGPTESPLLRSTCGSLPPQS